MFVRTRHAFSVIVMLWVAACASPSSGLDGGLTALDAAVVTAADSGVSDSGATLDASVSTPDAGKVDAGQTGHDGGGSCRAITAAVDVDPWSVALPSIGFGGTLLDNPGSHHDVYLKSPAPLADYTRIAVRLDWGGTVVFWGLGSNPASNTIDALDTGRELQVALYDPRRNRQSCAFDASCLTSTTNCGNSITYLGWDPVQGGDECVRGAPATWQVVGDALRVTVTPVQWNPDWDAPDCRSSSCTGDARPAQVQYVMDLRFVDPLLVEVSLEVRSLEAIDHELTSQEFPTLYVSHGGPDLPQLLDASGAKIDVDLPANDGFTYRSFTSSKPWVAFQNIAHDYGVGIAMDQGVTLFQGWNGDGSRAPYFHNVRAGIAFGLSHGSIVRGRSYLALGGFETIASTVAKRLAKRPPFGAVDGPGAGTLSRGSNIQITGWVLDTDALQTVTVELDAVVIGTVAVTGARPDVCGVYPGYAGCPMAGFSGMVSVTLPDGCAHLLAVVATDADGNRTVLGERLVQR